MVGCFLGAVKIDDGGERHLLAVHGYLLGGAAQCDLPAASVPTAGRGEHRAGDAGHRPDRGLGLRRPAATSGRGSCSAWPAGLSIAGVSVGMRGLRDLDPTWLTRRPQPAGYGGAGPLGRAGRPGDRIAERRAIPGPDRVRRLPDGHPVCPVRPGTARDRAPEAGLIGLVEPILNPIWVVLFVHERPAGPTVIGGLFLLAGLAYRYWPCE